MKKRHAERTPLISEDGDAYVLKRRHRVALWFLLPVVRVWQSIKERFS